jgi:bifunctional oligoribonuclease and PAP phosphatase NrnA
MNTLVEVVDALRARQRWVVTSHARPDGDAVGSVLGCVQILRAMGKQADGFLGDSVPFIYRGLPGAADLRPGPVDASHYDGAVIIECDCVERTQLDGLVGLFSVNIDHHETFAEYADINYVVSSAAAASELVYRVAVCAGVAITPEIATCLYTAMLTDTGSFCYSSTNAHTFAFAREMVLAGAVPAAVAQQVYFSNPACKMHLLGRALSSLQCEGGLSWMHVSEADMLASGASGADCEGLVNWALGIHGVEATAFFREIAGSRYRVSLRSKGRIDVARIAKAFGGGGHSCASGHIIAGPLEVATDRVLAALRHALELSSEQSAG